MSTYQLEIDGSGAEAGAERIVKSFDAIKAAADRMEGGVSAAAKKASNSFSEMQKNARPVSEAAINSLKQLSAVFSSFKAPSDAAVRNTIIFLQGLKSVGSLNLGTCCWIS
jgi:phage-related minor tail protein